MAALHEPNGCIFCGSSDLTEEAPDRRLGLPCLPSLPALPLRLRWTFVGPGELHISPEEPIATARVLSQLQQRVDLAHRHSRRRRLEASDPR